MDAIKVMSAIFGVLDFIFPSFIPVFISDLSVMPARPRVPSSEEVRTFAWGSFFTCADWATPTRVELLLQRRLHPLEYFGVLSADILLL